MTDFKSACLDNVRVDEFYFCSNFDSGNLGKVEVVPPEQMTGWFNDSSHIHFSFSFFHLNKERNHSKKSNNKQFNITDTDTNYKVGRSIRQRVIGLVGIDIDLDGICIQFVCTIYRG